MCGFKIRKLKVTLCKCSKNHRKTVSGLSKRVAESLTHNQITFDQAAAFLKYADPALAKSYLKKRARQAARQLGENDE
ncbi:hypothetical protein CRI87_08120 [Liquorilactobacillus satsumensis]|nr:hypothetical protein [Liquorilactobacillus satsumensis]